MAVGIGCGVFSGILLKKIPEPPGEQGDKRIRLVDTIRRASTDPSLKNFVVILFFVALVSGVSRAFMIVYSREVFFQSDGMVSLYSVFGGLGVLLIGLLIKFFVDRVGAKPIFIICVITGLAAMIPIVFFPQGMADNFTTVTLFLTFIFFVINFGFLGAEGIAQTYFLALVPAEMMLDMGILYFFVFGIAGAGGSFAAGLFLDILSALGLARFLSFKILYLILTVLTLLIIVLQRKMVSLGALPFKGALEVIFSYRDLRAITLLDRLNKTNDSHEEEALLGALHDSPSRLAVKGLLTRAKSPRLATRLESIRALENLKTLDEDTIRALMDDVITNPYTTAYISARILGNHGVSAAIPVLRELAGSRDYMLAGEAMIALAKLEDQAFRPQIERIILKTKNPRLKIMGVEAFGFYGSPNSLSVLLDILRGQDPPPYLRDEVVLAMASILAVQNTFYPLLVRFRDDESLGPTLAVDEAEAAAEYYHAVHGGWKGRGRKILEVSARQARAFQGVVRAYAQDFKGAPLSRWILELPGDLVHGVVQMVLSEAVLDDELAFLGRLRLLIVHWAARELRLWTNHLKI
jgi:MFS family permease